MLCWWEFIEVDWFCVMCMDNICDFYSIIVRNVINCVVIMSRYYYYGIFVVVNGIDDFICCIIVMCVVLFG